MRNWLFYLCFIVICVSTGLYWAWVDKGKPSKESILFMIIAVGVLMTVRAISVGEKPFDFSLNIKRKFQRFKKIWFSK